jgi:hypothetical protein
MKFYKTVEQFVTESFKNAGNETSLKHLVRTVYWLLQLNPNADEATQVAALSHDIERAFRVEKQNERLKQKGFKNEEHLEEHQNRGAEIMADFLTKEGASSDFIAKVKHLISKHEVGGDNEQNLIKDADSLSFFENNVKRFVEVLTKDTSKEAVKEKLDWMYDRITLDCAKQIARPWYDEGIRLLG